MKQFISGKIITEIWALNREYLECLGEGLNWIFEDKARSDAAYAKSEMLQEELDVKFRELRQETDAFIALMARSLLDATGTLSISKYAKCINVCTGAEVDWDAKN